MPAVLWVRYQLGGQRKDISGSRQRGPATYDPKDKMAFFKDNVVTREEVSSLSEENSAVATAFS